ncbi:hypothetical protein ACFQ4Z_12660 [Oceanobacillus oncorhynchi subsp. oncorhynchi]|uniref:hypothetical protein n=1 Tax=Oceanobacillus oncorhynchi TaxID=545501 RepID=UPI00362559CD
MDEKETATNKQEERKKANERMNEWMMNDDEPRRMTTPAMIGNESNERNIINVW